MPHHWLIEAYDYFKKILKKSKNDSHRIISKEVLFMKTIIIKPHHFIDIIKLYGSGIDYFVPDDKMGHDFYKIANDIINHPDVKIILTIEADDICQPCYQFHKRCIDKITSISGIISKDIYNQLLDTRIISVYSLDQNYDALSLCQILYKHHEYIDQIWQEEDQNLTKRRHDFFVAGAKKYLKRYL